MALITLPFTFIDDTIADADEVMSNLNAILAQVNGNLDAANIAADAIGSANIAPGAVDNAALGANAVTSDKILANTILAGDLADDSVGHDALAGLSFFNELGTGNIDPLLVSFSVVPGLSVTPGAGTYLLIANFDFQELASDHQLLTGSIFVNGGAVGNDALWEPVDRVLGTARCVVSTSAVATVGAGQAIDLRAKTAGFINGTVKCLSGETRLTVVRIA